MRVKLIEPESLRDAFMVWKGRGGSRVGFRIGSLHELKLYRISLSGRTRVSGRKGRVVFV